MNNASQIEIVHEVELAEDFLERWTEELADGEAGDIIDGPIYPLADISGLWRT